MDRFEFEKKWSELKKKISTKWNKFSEKDLAEINGNYDQFMNRLQHKYGYSRDQAEREIKNWHMEGERSEKGHKPVSERMQEEKSTWDEGRGHKAHGTEEKQKEDKGWKEKGKEGKDWEGKEKKRKAG